jgi:hypothetical protein
MNHCSFGILTLFSVLLGSPARAQKLKVALDITDSTAIFESSFASAFRLLGDIEVVTTEESPDYVLEGVVLCRPRCTDAISYALAVRWYEPVEYGTARRVSWQWLPGLGSERRSVQRDSLSKLIWDAIEGSEWNHMSWVLTWGRERYEQGVRELVREIDARCLERRRALRRAVLSTDSTQYQAYRRWASSREWIC